MMRGKVTAVDARGVFVQTAEYGVLGPCQWAGERPPVTASVLVVDVGDPAAPELVVVGEIGGGMWTAYTPTLTSSGTQPTNWTRTGRYIRRGGLVVANFKLVASASMTAGTGEYYVSPPVPMNTSLTFRILGVARLRDSSGSVNAMAYCQQDGSNDRIRFEHSAAWPTGASVVTWSGGPWTWASGDTIDAQVVYEAA